eukprot:scaffold28840_cov49-Prasinocladus_malaysianus.AAC.1
MARLRWAPVGSFCRPPGPVVAEPGLLSGHCSAANYPLARVGHAGSGRGLRQDCCQARQPPLSRDGPQPLQLAAQGWTAVAEASVFSTPTGSGSAAVAVAASSVDLEPLRGWASSLAQSGRHVAGPSRWGAQRTDPRAINGPRRPSCLAPR